MSYFKKRTLTTMLIGLFAISSFLLADNLSSKIEEIINKTDPDLNYGIIVQSLDTGKLLYSKNANRYFKPASTLKVMIGLFALKELGPDYLYSTRIYGSNAANCNDEKNIYLKFSGDPTFTSDNLTDLFKQLPNHGINEIKGNLVYDYSGYTTPKICGGWMIEDIEVCEITPISKAIINGNFYSYSLLPGKNIGDPAKLISKNKLALPYPIENNVTTVGDLKEIVWRKYGFEDGTIKVYGKIGIDNSAWNLELPIDTVDHYVKDHIQNALENAGLKLKGEIRKGVTPKDVVVLEEHSKPLIEILTPAMKDSTNFFFQSVIPEAISRNSETLIISWPAALDYLKKSLKKNYNLNIDKALLEDMGLSHYTMITPNQLLEALIIAYEDPEISKIFIPTFPINGIDGNLKDFANEERVKGKIKAKTGTLRTVSNLAGYIKTQSNQNVVIVIMMNNLPWEVKKYKDLKGEICTAIYDSI